MDMTQDVKTRNIHNADAATAKMHASSNFEGQSSNDNRGIGSS